MLGPVVFVCIQGQNQKPDAVKISTWLYVTGEKATTYLIPFHFRHVYSIVKPKHSARESLFSLCMASVDVDVALSGHMTVNVLLICNFTSGFVHMHTHRKQTDDTAARKTITYKVHKSSSSKHSTAVSFTASTLKKQVHTERGVRCNLQEPSKEETAWFWRRPGRGCISWESGNAHSRGSPMSSAHAFSSSFTRSPVLPIQPATFLLAEVPSAWASSPLVKTNPAVFLCRAPHLGQPWKHTHYAPLLQAWSLSVLLSLSLPPPLQQNTMGNPRECQVNTLTVIHRFAIIRELCSSELFIKGMPQR